MIGNHQTDVAENGTRLVYGAYLAWFSAESQSGSTLHAWFEAPGEQRTSAYLAYRAALDREEAAARNLERLLQRSECCRESLVRDGDHQFE